jgi:hypothetical protein
MSRKAAKLQPDTPIFKVILDAAVRDLNASLSAVTIDTLQDAAEASLFEICGPAASGMAKQFAIDDVRRELLRKHRILTIPVFKTFFTKRDRLRALHGELSPFVVKGADGVPRRAVITPPDPVRLLPIGHGKIKSGLVRADAYPTLLALWTQRDRTWANGSWGAYDRRLGEIYDAHLLDRNTLQILIADPSVAAIPKTSNLARIIDDVRRRGVEAIAGPA